MHSTMAHFILSIPSLNGLLMANQMGSPDFLQNLVSGLAFLGLVPLMISLSLPKFLRRGQQPEFVRYTEGRLGVAFVRELQKGSNNDATLQLEVHVPGHQPYQTSAAVQIAAEAWAKVQPGAMVSVLTNQSNVNSVKVML